MIQFWRISYKYDIIWYHMLYFEVIQRIQWIKFSYSLFKMWYKFFKYHMTKYDIFWYHMWDFYIICHIKEMKFLWLIYQKMLYFIQRWYDILWQILTYYVRFWYNLFLCILLRFWTKHLTFYVIRWHFLTMHEIICQFWGVVLTNRIWRFLTYCNFQFSTYSVRLDQISSDSIACYQIPTDLGVFCQILSNYVIIWHILSYDFH